jgi:hypothetical protein
MLSGWGVESGIFEPHRLAPSPSTESGKREKEGPAPPLRYPGVEKNNNTEKLGGTDIPLKRLKTAAIAFQQY